MDYIKITRYIFLIVPLLGELYKIPPSQCGKFMFLFLIIFLSSQLRRLNLNYNINLFSYILEPLLIIYISHLYAGFCFIIIFSTIIDACINLKKEIYPYALFTGLILIYLIKNTYSMELVFMIVMFYITIILILLQLQKEFSIREDTEALYDKIRKYAYELERAKARLIDYSNQVEKVAQLEERNRISRELHDSIGHNLTGVLMQVDACIQIMNVNSEKGIELLHSIYNNINNSIENVRQTVQKLRPIGYRNNLEALRELISKYKTETGVNIELQIKGGNYGAYPAAETVIYNNVKEAITNSVRHSRCRTINIMLLYSEQYIEAFISDDGIGTADLKKGFGLKGIEERINLIGGTVSFSGSKGFHIHMTIPKDS